MAVDLDLDLVRCFVTVVDTRGFTAAGKRLGLSQSAISLKVQRLETLLQCKLVDRARALKLTTEGELLLSYARRLLALSEEAVQRVAAPDVKGVLNLGIVEYFAPTRLAELLSSYGKSHPNVQLNVEVGLSPDLFAGLETGRLDFIVATSTDAPGDRKSRQFRYEQFLMKEPRVWVRGESMEINPHEPLPLALLPERSSYRQTMIKLLERTGRSWRVVFTGTSQSSMEAAVRSGLAITVFNRSSVTPGMVVMDETRDRLPRLPDTEVGIFARDSLDPALIQCLSKVFLRLVEETANAPVASVSDWSALNPGGSSGVVVPMRVKGRSKKR